MEQTLLRLHRDGDSVREETLGEVRFVPLVSGAVALPGGLLRAAGPERPPAADNELAFSLREREHESEVRREQVGEAEVTEALAGRRR